MWIRNPDRSRAQQLQNGRFHYNWARTGEGHYPRYGDFRPEFEQCFDRFCRFVSSESLGEVRPNQWELTYINVIDKGTVWEEPADWRDLFASTIQLPSELHDCGLESFQGEWHYRLQHVLGRLHVQLRHARHSETQSEALILTLTARGPAGDGGTAQASLFEGLDRGHEAIVRSFVNLTAQHAHQHWELEP